MYDDGLNTAEMVNDSDDFRRLYSWNQEVPPRPIGYEIGSLGYSAVSSVPQTVNSEISYAEMSEDEALEVDDSIASLPNNAELSSEYIAPLNGIPLRRVPYMHWGRASTPDGDERVDVEDETGRSTEDISNQSVPSDPLLRTNADAMTKRLYRELVAIHKDSTFTAGPENENNIKIWKAEIQGPKDSAYENIKFDLRILFDEHYPSNPPVVKFTRRIFHPNVYPTGEVCMTMLGAEWLPEYSVSAILLAVQIILDDPNISSPANLVAAHLFSTNKESYMKTALLHANNEGDMSEELNAIIERDLSSLPPVNDEIIGEDAVEENFESAMDEESREDEERVESARTRPIILQSPSLRARRDREIRLARTNETEDVNSFSNDNKEEVEDAESASSNDNTAEASPSLL